MSKITCQKPAQREAGILEVRSFFALFFGSFLLSERAYVHFCC